MQSWHWLKWRGGGFRSDYTSGQARQVYQLRNVGIIFLCLACLAILECILECRAGAGWYFSCNVTQGNLHCISTRAEGASGLVISCADFLLFCFLRMENHNLENQTRFCSLSLTTELPPGAPVLLLSRNLTFLNFPDLLADLFLSFLTVFWEVLRPHRQASSRPPITETQTESSSGGLRGLRGWDHWAQFDCVRGKGTASASVRY